jgi:hypothetical protein
VAASRRAGTRPSSRIASPGVWLLGAAGLALPALAMVRVTSVTGDVIPGSV